MRHDPSDDMTEQLNLRSFSRREPLVFSAISKLSTAEIKQRLLEVFAPGCNLN